MIPFLYCIIIFFATTMGALVGLGGGVIIKPMLDLVSFHNVETVGFISAVAVFSMSVSATIKHIRNKTKFDVPLILFISFGSAVGGVAGNEIFDLLLNKFNSSIVKGVQGIILGLLLIAVNIYVNSNAKSFRVKNKFAIVSVGLFLGMSASFLGVGGGPINVAFLVLFFSLSMKESAVYSVAIIFFSQLTKLITIYSANHFEPFDLTMLLYIIPCAVIGGLLGAKLNKKSNEKTIKIAFTICVYGVAFVSLYNGAVGLIG